MSKTRRRLQRLFQPPNVDAAGGFEARNLEAKPREFGPQGEAIASSSVTGERGPSRGEPAPKNDGAQTSSPLEKRHEKTLINNHLKNDAPAGRAAIPSHATSPLSASKAFESWSKSRASKETKRSAPTQETAVPEQVSPPVQAPESRSESAGTRDHRISSQASFDAWREKRRTQQQTPDLPELNDARGTSTAEKPEAFSQDARTPREAPSSEAPPAAGASPATSPRDSDRTRRRAKLAATHPQVRQPTTHPASASKSTTSAAITRGETRASRVGKTSTLVPTATQSAAERIAWVYAHREALSPSETLSFLQDTDTEGLRAALRARHLQLLATAQISLGSLDSAKEKLELLLQCMPTDTWAMLKLAELYANSDDELERAQQWVERLLHQSPWLSSAKELQSRIEQRRRARKG